MVLSLQISPEAAARLEARAAEAGVDVSTYASRQLELVVASGKSLVDLSGPIGEAFAASGMSEDDLSEFLEHEKHTARRERQAERGQ